MSSNSFIHYDSLYEEQKRNNSGIHGWIMDFTQQYPTDPCRASCLDVSHALPDSRSKLEHREVQTVDHVPYPQVPPPPNLALANKNNCPSEAFQMMRKMQNYQTWRDDPNATMNDLQNLQSQEQQLRCSRPPDDVHPNDDFGRCYSAAAGAADPTPDCHYMTAQGTLRKGNLANPATYNKSHGMRCLTGFDPMSEVASGGIEIRPKLRNWMTARESNILESNY